MITIVFKEMKGTVENVIENTNDKKMASIIIYLFHSQTVT